MWPSYTCLNNGSFCIASEFTTKCCEFCGHPQNFSSCAIRSSSRTCTSCNKNEDVPFKEGLQMGECGGNQLKGKGGLRSHPCVEAIASELGNPDQNPKGSATPWGVHPAPLLSPNVFSIPFYLQSLPYKASNIQNASWKPLFTWWFTKTTAFQGCDWRLINERRSWSFENWKAYN